MQGSRFQWLLVCLVLGLTVSSAMAGPEKTEILWTERLMEALDQAPPESAGKSVHLPVIELPTASGTVSRFAITRSHILPPELAARFPTIRTYRGIGLDEPTAQVWLDHSPLGLHATVRSQTGTLFIDPVRTQPHERGRITLLSQMQYQESWSCESPAHAPVDSGVTGTLRALRRIAGDKTRTYRIAIAATGEYTAFHGGTVEAGLAAVTVVLNRIAGIFERDASIRLVLAKNNDRLIYTNPETDPYTNDEPTVITAENQRNLDAVIGRRRYDLGHVFGTYPLGRVDGLLCDPSRKGMAVSGFPSPTPEFFAIQLVAHEIGHQFGANHTYNGTSRVCGGYRVAQSAWEPGSGSTIMSYAGVCSPENVARLGDDYFHTGSLDEILGWVSGGVGATCGKVIASDNRPPQVNAGRNYRIPIGTPFTLAGTARDPDGDPLTYVWEQFDLGPASPPMADDGLRPLFRSYPPVAEPTRTIPRVQDLRRGRSTKREILPSTRRKLTFRLTVRDGRGGVARDTMKLWVKDQAGPFSTLMPEAGDQWRIGRQARVKWDVAHTDSAPIRCQRVDLWLSTDGGRSFPHKLLARTLNDGSETIIAPNMPTTRARLKVSCSNNVFFAITDGDFTVQP